MSEALGFRIASALAPPRERPVWRCLGVAQSLKLEAKVRQHMISRRLHGRAWVRDNIILAPKGRNPDELYILAHECAHLVLRHYGLKAEHVEEFEAEQWAHAALARHGVEVSPAMRDGARAYVARLINKARRAKIAIDPAALAFAQGESP